MVWHQQSSNTGQQAHPTFATSSMHHVGTSVSKRWHIASFMSAMQAHSCVCLLSFYCQAEICKELNTPESRCLMSHEGEHTGERHMS